MSWLIRDGDVLAALETKRRGWRTDLRGALILSTPTFVHTFGMGPGLDVAVCRTARIDADADGDEQGLRVHRVKCLAARRLTAPHVGGGALVVAPLGSFERWRLRAGDLLEVRQA